MIKYIIILFLIAYSYVLYYYFKKAFIRPNHGVVEGDSVFDIANKEARKKLGNYHYKTIEYTTKDNLKLQVYYYDLNQEKTVILVHGFHNNAFHEYESFLPFYLENGYNVLLYDQRSHGNSEGKYIHYGYKESDDLNEIVKSIIPSSHTVIYHGISMGAATVLQACGKASKPENVIKIISDCGYSSLERELKAVLNSMNLPWYFILPPINIIHKLMFGFSIKDVDVAKAVKNINIPILYFHGDIDTYVPTSMVYDLVKNTKTSTLYIIEGAIHAACHIVSKEQYEKIIYEYLSNNVDE